MSKAVISVSAKCFFCSSRVIIMSAQPRRAQHSTVNRTGLKTRCMHAMHCSAVHSRNGQHFHRNNGVAG